MKKLLMAGFCLVLGLSLVAGCGGSGSAIQPPIHVSPSMSPSLPSPPTSPSPPPLALSEYAAPGGPNGITTGPDGNLWFSQMLAFGIGKITPGGKVSEMAIPGAIGEITTDRSGNLWFTTTNGVDKMTPTGTVTAFSVLAVSGVQLGITAGPDGNLWFTDLSDNEIGKITQTGAVTEFPVPTPSNYRATLGGIISAGPDGNLWFPEEDWGPTNCGRRCGSYGASHIDKISLSGAVTEYPLPSSGAYADWITTGPDGNVWFAEPFAGKVGKITLSGAITEFQVPWGGTPCGITVGPDHNLWFVAGTGTDGISRIGRITTSGMISGFAIPANANADCNMTAGPDANLWFTDFSDSKIYKFKP